MRYLAFALLLVNSFLHAQSYPPAAGQEGSTAIAAESTVFVSWATGIEVTRGLIDISDPTAEDNGSTFASYGSPEDALGVATVNPVSLGDGGEAVLTFDTPIGNGEGFDFAVFENSFSDTFLELAFVEVSSDGTNFFRFPSHSQTQTNEQVEGFGNVDPTYINNLAGKYRALFGTPFDLSEVPDNSLLDKNAITHIKIIDVVGSIDPEYARYDDFGNVINEPFSTPFYSGGFDLDAVGVINEEILAITETFTFEFKLYPNPATTDLFISTQGLTHIRMFDTLGRDVFSGIVTDGETIDISALKNGIYLVQANYNGKKLQRRVIKK
ncbi:hypothetical protein SCB49_00110 [unidentified eubacterium SCB49]|nr:hypothetical protein SCB49_00110 [unidentified eubacterium SCB49]